MGLFNKDKQELEQALEGFRSNVGANAHHAVVAEASPVQERLARLERAVARMESKGKDQEILTAIAQVYDTQLPFTTWGLGDGSVADLKRLQALVYDGGALPELKGSGPAAEAELELRVTINNHRAADAYYKSVLAAIRARLSQRSRT